MKKIVLPTFDGRKMEFTENRIDNLMPIIEQKMEYLLKKLEEKDGDKRDDTGTDVRSDV